jgi:hypothetical protein
MGKGRTENKSVKTEKRKKLREKEREIGGTFCVLK